MGEHAIVSAKLAPFRAAQSGLELLTLFGGRSLAYAEYVVQDQSPYY